MREKFNGKFDGRSRPPHRRGRRGGWSGRRAGRAFLRVTMTVSFARIRCGFSRAFRSLTPDGNAADNSLGLGHREFIISLRAMSRGPRSCYARIGELMKSWGNNKRRFSSTLLLALRVLKLGLVILANQHPRSES